VIDDTHMYIQVVNYILFNKVLILKKNQRTTNYWRVTDYIKCLTLKSILFHQLLLSITLIFSIIMQLQDHGQVLSNSNVNLVTWDDFIAGTWLETTLMAHFHLICSHVQFILCSKCKYILTSSVCSWVLK
jgi:hypothetical protein